MALVKLSALHHDRDGAGTNDNIVAMIMEDVKRNDCVLVSDWLGGNHCNNLIEHSTGKGTHDGRLLPPLYSLALLLRMGGYIVRVIAATGRLFSLAPIERRRGSPERRSIAFVAELGDYVVRNDVCYTMQRRAIEECPIQC